MCKAGFVGEVEGNLYLQVNNMVHFTSYRNCTVALLHNIPKEK